MKLTIEARPLSPGSLAGLRSALVGGEINEGEPHAGTEFGVDVCLSGTALWWHIKRTDEESTRYYSISMAELCNQLVHATLEDTEGGVVIAEPEPDQDQGGGE
jgi:hypothetical protein